MSSQEGFDLAAKGFIAVASFGQECRPPLGFAFQCFVKYLLCLLPSFGSHWLSFNRKPKPSTSSPAKHEADSHHRAAWIDKYIGAAEILTEEIIIDQPFFRRTVQHIENVGEQLDPSRLGNL
jgi:hypothetical protein